MAPTAFAGRDPLPDEARSHFPRPERLAEPLPVKGEKMAKAAERLGLSTVGKLLEHIPRDRAAARTIATLVLGEVASVVVEVRSISSRPVRRRGRRPAHFECQR